MNSSAHRIILFILVSNVLCFGSTAQVLSYTVSGPVCVNGSASVAVTASPSNTSFFSWSVSPTAGFVSTTTVNAQGLLTFSSCGVHTLTCFAFTSASVLIGTSTSTQNVSCPGITLTPSSQTICAGATASVSAAGAASYNWNTGATTSSILVSPATNTSYLVLGNTGCAASASITIFNMTLAASASQLCPSTQLSLTSLGGTSYNWMQPPNSIFATTNNSMVVVSPTLLPVTYTVFGVFGSSCISVQTISVGLFPFSVSPALSSSVCSGVGSTLSLPATASYTWAGPSQTLTGNTFTFSQNFANSYTVFADSSGCLANTSFSVGMNPTPALTITASSATICANQIVNLFVNGAVNYTWVTHPSLLSSLFGSSVMAGPFVSTVYSVSGTNSFGCRGFTNYSVTVGIIPSLVATSISNTLCAGFSTTLSAVGANSYSWISTTFTGAVISPTLSGGAGTYTVIASNGGTCRDSTILNITLTPPLILTVSQSASATCIQGDGYIEPINFTVTGAGTYTWLPFTPGLMTYSLGPNTSVTPTVSTCYTVTGANTDCTGAAVLCVNSGYCSGLNDLSDRKLVQVYPNPVGEHLFFKCGTKTPVKISIIDLQGQTIISADYYEVPTSICEIPTASLEPGLYYFLSQTQSGSFQAIKFMKE